MISSWMIYLLTRLTSIKIGLTGICMATSTISIVSYLCEKDFGESLFELIKSTWFKFTVITAITSGLLLIAIPSTKEAVAIWLVPKVVNNEDVQGSISKLPKFANKYLEEQLKEYTEGEEANGSSND